MYSHPDVLVSDLLTRCSTGHIFHGLLRDVDSVYSRLGDESKFTVILAPQDRTMIQLQRKPWEMLDDFATFGLTPYEGEEGQARAARNLERFVEDHVVVDPMFMRQEVPVKTLGGAEIWYQVGRALGPPARMLLGDSRGHALTVADRARPCRGYRDVHSEERRDLGFERYFDQEVGEAVISLRTAWKQVRQPGSYFVIHWNWRMTFIPTQKQRLAHARKAMYFSLAL